MFKLVVDASSIVKAFMFLKDEEFGTDVQFEGEKFHIPDVETSLERLETSIEKTLKTFDLQWRDIIWVSDPAKSGHARRLLFPEYRTGRPSRPPEWKDTAVKLLDQAKQMVMSKGGVSATPKVKPAVEADDLCNEICKRFPETILWARDKDLLACPATIHFQDGDINPEKFPADRQHISLYRTIVSGDKSDGIKSCKGFGDKAWSDMIATFGYECLDLLQELFENRQLSRLAEDVDDFPKLQMIIDQREDLYLGYEVMQFMHVPAHKVDWEARCQECAKVAVVSDNFEEVLAEVKKVMVNASYSTIDYEAATGEESKAWCEKSGVGFDTLGFRSTGLGLKIEGHPVTYYFSNNHADTNNITLEQLEMVLLSIRDKPVVGQNLVGFEQILTYTHFGWMFNKPIDTAIMASYVNEEDYVGLKGLSKRWLQYDQASYAATVGNRGMDEVTVSEVLDYGADDCITCEALFQLFSVIMTYEGTLEVFYQVEVDASIFTSLCFAEGINFDSGKHAELVEANEAKMAELRPKLAKLLGSVGWVNPNGRKVIKTRTAASIRRLYEAVTGKELDSDSNTVKGILPSIDHEEVKTAVESGAKFMDELYEKHYVPEEVPINVNSTVQVKKLFYEVLNLPVRKRRPPTDKMRKEGKEGSPLTDEKAVNNALAFGDGTEEARELLKTFTEYKGCLTRDSLFLSKYPNLCHWTDGKLHCNMRQSATTTRRWTHSNPNLAQQSKRKGKEMRDMIVSPKGYKLLALDFSGQELSLSAWDSQCKEFLACFIGREEEKKSVHSLTGFQINKLKGGGIPDYETFVKLAEIDKDPEAKEWRSKGKNTNFSCQFGSMAPNLSWGLAVPIEDAEAFMEAREKAFPGLNPSIKKYHKLCKERGYATTRLGARRHLHTHYARKGSKYEIAAADRLAYSMRIQGSAAEQVKLALGRITRASNFYEDDTIIPVMTIHDEVVMLVKDELLDEYVPILHDLVCEKYADMEIQPESQPEVGVAFGSLQEWVPGINLTEQSK